MPRVKSADVKLLHRAHGRLCYHAETDLAQQLGVLLDRLEAEQEKERVANRNRAARNRQSAYAWPSSNKPKRSKYYGNEQDRRVENERDDSEAD